jgi:hypothetical protein
VVNQYPISIVQSLWTVMVTLGVRYNFGQQRYPNLAIGLRYINLGWVLWNIV